MFSNFVVAISHKYGVDVISVSGQVEADRVLADWALRNLHDVPEDVQRQIKELIKEKKFGAAHGVYFDAHPLEFAETRAHTYPPETAALDEFLADHE